MLQLPEILTKLTPWSVALRIFLALLIGGLLAEHLQTSEEIAIALPLH